VTESGRTYGYSKRLDFDGIALQYDCSAAICALKGHACFHALAQPNRRRDADSCLLPPSPQMLERGVQVAHRHAPRVHLNRIG
jgi:hypothetical protein